METPTLEDQLQQQRQERVDRASKAIKEICETERVSVVVAGFALQDGKLIPQIIVAAN